MTPQAVIAAVLLALGAAPAAARAETTTFRGVTDAGRTITLETDTTGQATQLSLLWRPRCPPRVRFGVQRTTFVPTGGEASAPALLGKANFRLALAGGRIAQVRLRVTGALHGSAPAAQRWTGRLKARVAIRRLGRAAGTCTLSSRWRAGREGVGTGSFAMDSERGDWLGGGMPYRYDAANATISAKGTPHVVTVHVEGQDHRDWDASFSAPSLNELRAGQRYIPDSSVPGAARFDVRGDGRGCNAMPGSFTVQAIRFDSLRRLSELRVDYETHCDNGTAANRGSIAWRASG